MQRRIIENDAQPSLPRQRQQDFRDVRLIEIVSEHLERESRIVEYPIEHIKHLLARGLAHPIVNLRKGYRLSVFVGAGLRVGVEIQLLGLRNDRRVFSEVMHIGSRLHVSPGKSKRKRAFFERPNRHLHRDTQGRVQRLHRTDGIKVARSDRVGVVAKRGRKPLMGRARIMGPAVFLDGGIHSRVRRLTRNRPVFGGLLKLKEVLQIKAGHLSRRLAKDRETRKIFCIVAALEVEGQ